jgi:putative ABC transport system permease protein
LNRPAKNEILRIMEPIKDARARSPGAAWLEFLLHDLRFAVRTLAREPVFTVATILILTLAVGLNVTTFRVMNAKLFHGYPLVKQNERLLFVDERFPTPGCCVSYSDFAVWRSEARSFQDMAFAVFKSAAVSENADTVRDVQIGATTANTFRLLGVAPALGRDFAPSDEAAGAAPVLVVSHRYWIGRMGGRADAIGRVVQVDGASATIVGVLPEGFDFPQLTELWKPLAQTAELYGVVANGSYVFGRLADGASEAAARAELEGINARLAIEFPATNRDVRPVVRTFMDAVAGDKGPLIYGSLWAGAWLVLAIACANLANLALARAQGRAREISTRMALGAGRGRVLRQWLIENLLLAAAAGVLSWAAVVWSTRTWAAATATQYQIADFRPNFATLVYLVAVTLGAAAVITAVAVGHLWRLDVNRELKGEGRGATMSLRAKRLSAALVAGQMTLAIVLMSGAGVLGHSLWNVLTAPLGIEAPENILIGRLELPRAKYPTPEARSAFFESLRTRLAAIPGITSAAIAGPRPTDDWEPRPVEIGGLAGSQQGAPVFPVGPGYFATIGAPVLVGRDFFDADRPTATPVAIVNRSFAEKPFPGQNAVGQRIRLSAKREPEPGAWRTIVGVVGNVMQNDMFRQRFVPAVYVPFAQEPANRAWFFARAPHVSDGLVSVVRAEVAQLDAGLEIADLAALKQSLGFGLTQSGQPSAAYSELSRQAAVAPIFAGLALLLAALGLYAVIARSIGQRTKEIGVRMALGAAPRAIGRLVLFEGMVPVAAGLVIGLAASLGVNRVLQSQLVGVSPYDALTLTVAPLVLISVALFGCLVPLCRAVRVDPMVALRHD